MSDPILIAEWPLSSQEHLRLSIDRFKGVDLIDLRKWFKSDDGQFRPGRQGIALRLKYLPQLADAFAKACEIACERRLIDGGTSSHQEDGAP